MSDLCIVDDTIGEHEWIEYEARAQLDSRTYMVKGVKFKWRCAHCKETREGYEHPEANRVVAGGK